MNALNHSFSFVYYWSIGLYFIFQSLPIQTQPIKNEIENTFTMENNKNENDEIENTFTMENN